MRQLISVNAIFVGLCALLPVPFLDDVLRRVLMRGAYQAIAERQGVHLEPAALQALTHAPPLRMLGCMGALFWYPVKKLSRTILYFLTVKDALDWTAEAAVRGELFSRALRRGLLPEQAATVRQAMDTAWKAHGGSPITRTLLLSQHEELDWSAGEGAAVPVVRGLARRGAAVLVIRRFEQELASRQEAGAGPGLAGGGEGSGAENGS